ncbi:MAG: LPS export ABC transporter permease LptF [Alphaproteobacteria bacterium]|nr:LPS export ABC transporter permease LptF [Alphaproteobacteria bacterium]
MRKIAFLYVLRQLAWGTALVCVGLTCVIWLTQSLRFVDLIVNRGIDLAAFASLTLHLLPTYLIIVIPIALFASVLFTYNKLIVDSELIVLRAAGLRPQTLAGPAIVLALMLTVLCYSITLYFLPHSYREFKDLQFLFRHTHSAVLLREGVFNSLGEGLTVYVRERAGNGELFGILMHDSRDPEQSVTIMAEHGKFVRTDTGPKVILINGNRQEVDDATSRLQLLYFDRYTVDLGDLGQAPGYRWREPRERYLPELFFPESSYDDQNNKGKLIAEGHQRLISPFYNLSFLFLALACLLSGDFNRRGQAMRILTAVGLAIAVQFLGVGLNNLAAKMPVTIPLMYLNALLPIAFGYHVLATGGLRKRPIPAAEQEPRAG